MRAIPFPAAMICAAGVFAADAAVAQYSPWCAVYTGETGPNCSFVSREQCTAVAGIKGTCIPNSKPAPADEPAPAAIQRVRKQPDARPAAFKSAPPKSGAPPRLTASTGTSTRPAPRPALALPDPALLAPLPDFDCEFKAVVADASTPPPSGASRDQADPGTAGALQTKLDYERQCYRHAAMIAYDRLRRLQASVAETIKLIDAGARPALPLPDPALLASPAEFDCEFRTANLDGTGDARQTSGQAGSAEAALRMKLDYERQCYRHADMIARNRLRNLQAAAGETIRAGQRQGQPARPLPDSVARGAR
jgi:hypothetical protein